jgi:dTDP-4-dehydrorhamnose reductase
LGGTFHATGPEFVDRASLARLICEEFSLDENRIVPTPTRELGQAAPRPLKVRLECEKLRATGVPPFRPIKPGLQALRIWIETVQRDPEAVTPAGR